MYIISTGSFFYIDNSLLNMSVDWTTFFCFNVADYTKIHDKKYDNGKIIQSVPRIVHHLLLSFGP
jgi:hypothetical protein